MLNVFIVVVLMTLFRIPMASARTECYKDMFDRTICSNTYPTTRFIIIMSLLGVLVVIAAGCGIYMFFKRRRLEAAIAKEPMKGFSPVMAYAPPAYSSTAYPSKYDTNGPLQYPAPIASYPFVGFGSQRHQPRLTFADAGTTV